MFRNVVIGTPVVDPRLLIASDNDDWENNEKENTLFTDTRFLPVIMKEAGIVKSAGEVRRNKPELAVELTKLDCVWVKWGKKFLYIVVGE